MKLVALRACVLSCSLPLCYAGSPIRFQNTAPQGGPHFLLNNGAAGNFHQIELMPGGVAALDYDNDGCTDLFFANGAPSPSPAHPALRKRFPADSNRLYRNNCNGTFEDVTAASGVAGAGYSNGAAVGDFNNDGFPDIFVAGVDRNILYRNRGNGTFEDVTAKSGVAGLNSHGSKPWSISAGWFDADNDGYLDLFVTNYVAWNAASEKPCGAPDARLYCHPANYAPLPNQIFRNNGDGTFTDMSEKSGIGASLGKGMGVAFADFDGDGRMDIFVANDSFPNFLFRNLGGFRFKESGYEMGVALPENGRAIAGMGADFRDYDNDGLPDVAITGMVNDAFQLFRNIGKPLGFDDWTARGGLAASTRSLTGWGVGFFDFDNDGFKDLFFAASHFPEIGRYLGSPAPLANRIFRNSVGKFEDVSLTAGADFQAAGFYRGAAFADFDNDGRMDVVVSAIGSPALLLRNVSETGNHWLAVKLCGTASNRDGIGASIKVTLPDGRSLYNHATTSVGYASSSERLVRFGLARFRAAETLEISWPSGVSQRLDHVAGDRVLEIREALR